MKSHISIFTFLLGAFAAGFAFEAGAAGQTVYGGQYFVKEKYGSSDVTHMSIDGKGSEKTKTGLSDGSEVTFVATPDAGCKIAQWGVLANSQYPTDSMKHEKYTWTDSTSTSYVWTANLKLGSTVYLAVNFRYITYDVTYVADGETPTPDAIRDQPYDESFNLATAPEKAGYAFAGWKPDTKTDRIYSAGQEVSGSDLCSDDWHEDGKTVKLTAQWAENGYSVSCKPNEGAWPAGYNPPARAVYDAVFSLPAPTRTGYDFIGWKVTSGLDTTTAKWGKGESPSSSVSADTLCVNGENEVYFKNLNPTNNAAVTLTAQWQPKTIRVTINNDGGSSGGGVLSFLDVTYAAAYPAVDVPSKGGSLFRGYKINGSLYWDKNGQVQKPNWDIPTNCTAVAQWEAGDYELIYDENKGADSKQVRRKFEYDTPTALYDGADFSNLGCTLLGWSTNKQAEKPDDGCEIGGIKSFTDSKTLYAVWEKNYFIAYDGNGATNETPMAVQKFIFGKSGQSLNPNIYGKVGYTFGDWATNRAAALRYEKKFKDKEVLTGDFATTVGETNTLYAIWKTNTYYVAFDMNGGTDVAPDVLRCAYDNPVNLTWTKKDGREFTNGAYDFLGWSNDISKVIYTDRTASVSNLCAIADGTNTLYAVWKLAPLSAAMHCDNLRWESYSYMGRKNKWLPSPDGNGAYQTGAKSTEQQWLLAQVPTNGTLSFSWIPNGCFGDKHLSVFISDNTNTISSITNLTGDGTKWESYTISDIPAEWYVHIYVSETSDMGLCIVDRMTWTPGGREPTDADKVTISSAAVVGGKFSLSFESKAEFDYNLLTNANLLINSWGVMTNEVGTGETITFEPQIIEGQPQMFYRVDTIRKK